MELQQFELANSVGKVSDSFYFTIVPFLFPGHTDPWWWEHFGKYTLDWDIKFIENVIE